MVLTGTRMDDGLCRFADEITEITESAFRCFSENEKQTPEKEEQ